LVRSKCKKGKEKEYWNGRWPWKANFEPVRAQLPLNPMGRHHSAMGYLDKNIIMNYHVTAKAKKDESSVEVVLGTAGLSGSNRNSNNNQMYGVKKVKAS
jgi:hypothetical protein